MLTKYKSEYDVVIIGAGIAGMFAALQINSDLKILLLSKDTVEISNTDLAQGGIAVTFDSNDFESHISDTLKTGNYYNDKEFLKIMVEEGAKMINTLLNWGVNFDTDELGNILFTKEGGHSLRRIVHYKDTTGHEIVKSLKNKIISQKNIFILENTFVVDLIIENMNVNGLTMIKDDVLNKLYCKKIVIATGGIGELYANTTNSIISTGDGVAFAYRAGVKIKDMEFVQFHPTALNTEGHSHFLISEAVRGEGGILRNENGVAFMKNYHELKDLAPRSIVSKAIIEESLKQENSNIYLDITHLDSEYILTRFPNIYKECLGKDINITNTLIPIIPVQHYIMGGIVTNINGETNISGLYACGEVACTGVHGANRMASNSLLEAIVFADRVATAINNKPYENLIKIEESIVKIEENIEDIFISSKRLMLQKIMSENVFIFREEKDLKKALIEIENIFKEIPKDVVNAKIYELINMLTVAKIIIESALNRKQSLGCHIINGGK